MQAASTVAVRLTRSDSSTIATSFGSRLRDQAGGEGEAFGEGVQSGSR